MVDDNSGGFKRTNSYNKDDLAFEPIKGIIPSESYEQPHNFIIKYDKFKKRIFLEIKNGSNKPIEADCGIVEGLGDLVTGEMNAKEVLEKIGKDGELADFIYKEKQGINLNYQGIISSINKYQEEKSEGDFGDYITNEIQKEEYSPVKTTENEALEPIDQDRKETDSEDIGEFITRELRKEE